MQKGCVCVVSRSRLIGDTLPRACVTLSFLIYCSCIYERSQGQAVGYSAEKKISVWMYTARMGMIALLDGSVYSLPRGRASAAMSTRSRNKLKAAMIYRPKSLRGRTCGNLLICMLITALGQV